MFNTAEPKDARWLSLSQFIDECSTIVATICRYEVKGMDLVRNESNDSNHICMQKVYLLLRNNQQSGPYSLEEILQLNLKPFDLVWMEGRSAAWRYPGEIDSLKPYVPEAPQPDLPFKPIATSVMDDTKPVQQSVPTPVNTSKKIFVSLPGRTTAPAAVTNEKPVENKRPEQEISVEQNERTQNRMADEGPLQTNYSRSLHDVEEDYTKWMFSQKTKKKTNFNKKDGLIVVGVLSIILLGYILFSQPSVISSSPVQQKAATQENAASPVVPLQEQDQEMTTVQKNNTAIVPVHPSKQEHKIASGTATKARNELPAINKQKNNDVAVVSLPEEEMIASDNSPLENKETNQPKQEKKKLREVLKGIFSKKDKNQTTEPTEEEPQPAKDRQATKRNQEEPAGNSATDFATLSSLIDINSNAPDNWMMGITGLKLSLRNNNNLALQSATVTVFYYDNNNQLLEKKLVYFNNVSARSTMTAAAPDHKFADHVSFRLTSATAKEDRYATR